jgi:glycine C-acetyltransferase
MDRSIAFSSRQQAVLSTVTAFGNGRTLFLGFPGCSLPLADAAVVAGADFQEIAHGDLRAALEKVKGKERTILFVESVSQITSEARDVAADCAVCDEFGAWVVVDESAALGLSGLRGAGSSEVVPQHPALLARISSLALTPGVDVTLIGAGAEFCELLERRSWYRQVDIPVSPIMCACGEAALELVELGFHGRELLRARCRTVREHLALQGWSLKGNESSLFLTLSCPSLRHARALQARLLQRGIVVEALPLRGFRRSEAVVRVLLSTEHTDAHLEILLEGLGEIRKRGGDEPSA